MAKTIAAILLLIVLLSASAAQAEQRTLRVLFVGNSLTYVNDLPATFAVVYQATQPDVRVETEMLAQGGALLREHLQAGELAQLLSREHFDVVVLQELGGLPLCPPSFAPCKDAPQALRDITALVRSHGARPLWFSTWQQLPSAQKDLSHRAAKLARDLQLETVDVGAAMQQVSPAGSKRLLEPDGHPQPLGTWLTAAALTASISGLPLPRAVPPPSCGSTWVNLRLTEPASRQQKKPAACYQPSEPQWRSVRAAIRN